MTFSRTPVEFERFAPIIGEHTHEVLRSLGKSEADIARLRAAKVI